MKHNKIWIAALIIELIIIVPLLNYYWELGNINHSDNNISTAEEGQILPVDYVGIDEIYESHLAENITTEEELPYEEINISMNFIGDCLLATNEGESYENCLEAVADREDKAYFFSEVSDIFLNDSVTVGDCENVFSDIRLGVSDKGQYDVPEDSEEEFKAFWFKSKAENAGILAAGGVDIVSLDNNHTLDYGAQGKEDTKAALEAAGVEWGERSKVVYKDIEGYRLAFVFGSMYSEGAVSSIVSDLETAKEESDYQIVYFHGGEEAVHSAESWKIRACHTLVDNGADLVLGDHPHVLQPMEVYNGVNIVYSLGNFVFGGNRHPENRTIIFNQRLTVHRDKKSGAFEIAASDYEIIPCYVYTGETNNWKPEIIEDEQQKKQVIDFMNGLTDKPL